LFFFSSSRRHTRFSRDWSSDVCSSDLAAEPADTREDQPAALSPWLFLLSGFVGGGLIFAGISGFCGMALLLQRMPWNRRLNQPRSEERRVGKECGTRGARGRRRTSVED